MKSDIWHRAAAQSPRRQRSCSGTRPLAVGKAESEGDAAQSGWTLVVGETGADWSEGIDVARQWGHNLTLVTQWGGESAAQFAHRVASRVSRRHTLGAVVLVCGEEGESARLLARAEILRRCLAALSDTGARRLTLVCPGERGRPVPGWVSSLVSNLAGQGSGLDVNLDVFTTGGGSAVRRAVESDVAPDSISAA